MKLFGNRKGAEHIAARKTEKKTGGLKRWQRVTIIVAAIVLVLGGTALAVYKVNVKPPVKQPEPVETEPLPEEETVKKPTVYVPATEVDEETGEETEVETRSRRVTARASITSSSRARTATATGRTRSSWRIWTRTRMRSP